MHEVSLNKTVTRIGIYWKRRSVRVLGAHGDTQRSELLRL